MVFKLLFTGGEDLKEIQRADDIKYMKLLGLTLKILCAWPIKQLTGLEPAYVKVGRLYTFMLETGFLPLSFLYLGNHYKELSFLEMGHSVITAMMNVAASSRTFLLFSERYFNIVADFITKIHLFNHKDKSKHSMKIHISVHKVCHFYTTYLLSVMVFGIIAFNCLPHYTNLRNGAFSLYNRPENITYEHSVYFELPFDYLHNTKPFIFMFFFDWYISFICCTIICSFDLMISIMVFHLWGHLKIIIHSLENFPRPNGRRKYFDHELKLEVEMYDDEEENSVFIRLTEIVKHHSLILEFTRRLFDIFGPIIVIYLIFHQISLCVLILECSQMSTEATAKYGLLTIAAFQQLIQITVIFEILNDSYQKLMDAAYKVPWECMTISHRKICLVLLRQSQKPMGFKAFGMVDVGVNTMASIIKTSISYFIFLRTKSSTQNH